MMKTREQITFDENIDSLVKELQGHILRKLSFFVDLEPTFDIEKIQFSFKYAHQLIMHTDKSDYSLGTAQTSTAIDALWTDNINSIDKTKKPDLTLEINEQIQNIKVDRGIEDYYYKLTLTTNKNTWTFISADIYDNNGTVDFKINDEMLLVFSDKQELEKFEKL